MEGANFAVRRLTGQKGGREREREEVPNRGGGQQSPPSHPLPQDEIECIKPCRATLLPLPTLMCVICAALEERGEAAESSFLLRNSLKRKEGEGPFIEWGEGIQNRPLETDGIGRVESGEGGLGKARAFVAFLKARFCIRNPFHVAFLPQ